jgi:hypothetical protein
MKFPLPLRDRASTLVARAFEDRTEKLLAEGLRLLGQFCAKMADVIESQRLARAGFGRQDKFLERLDYSQPSGSETAERRNEGIGSSEAASEETSFRR